MRNSMAFSTILDTLIVACVLGLVSVVASEGSARNAPKAKLIMLTPDVKDYMKVLGGPPETVTMRSGLVVLAPGKSVGTHNTDTYEEVLVVLQGEGKMLITDGPSFDLKPGAIAYCPPRTEHNVTNTRSGQLRYLYIVAKAEK